MGNSIRTCVSGGDVIESTSIEKCSSVSYHDCKQENFSCISSEVPFKPEASPQESEEFPPREPISSDANQEIIEALDQIFILCESGIDSTIAYIRNLHPDVDLVINDTRSYMINGAQVDMTPLQISAACGQVKVISQLLDCPHIMVNQIDPLFHMTALHMAVYYGHTLATEVLLKDIRVLINEKNIDGKTPLHLAVENQHNNIIEVMIRVRPQVDLRLKDFDGNNVLHMAAYHPNKEIMRTLLNHLSLVNFYRDYFDIADITMPNKFKNKNQLLQVRTEYKILFLYKLFNCFEKTIKLIAVD